MKELNTTIQQTAPLEPRVSGESKSAQTNVNQGVVLNHTIGWAQWTKSSHGSVSKPDIRWSRLSANKLPKDEEEDEEFEMAGHNEEEADLDMNSGEKKSTSSRHDQVGSYRGLFPEQTNVLGLCCCPSGRPARAVRLHQHVARA